MIRSDEELLHTRNGGFNYDVARCGNKCRKLEVHKNFTVLALAAISYTPILLALYYG